MRGLWKFGCGSALWPAWYDRNRRGRGVTVRWRSPPASGGVCCYIHYNQVPQRLWWCAITRRGRPSRSGSRQRRRGADRSQKLNPSPSLENDRMEAGSLAWLSLRSFIQQRGERSSRDHPFSTLSTPPKMLRSRRRGSRLWLIPPLGGWRRRFGCNSSHGLRGARLGRHQWPVRRVSRRVRPCTPGPATRATRRATSQPRQPNPALFATSPSPEVWRQLAPYQRLSQSPVQGEGAADQEQPGEKRD